jgi:PAS domain S-box-containing protein
MKDLSGKNQGLIEEISVLKQKIQELERSDLERKRAEEALLSESQFNRLVIENAGQGICVCHEIEEFPHVRFTVWNECMTLITGYSMAEINRLGWYQSLYTNPAIQERAILRMRNMRVGDNIQGEEWEITRADRQKRQLLITTRLHTGRNGESLVLGVMNDITERKQAEKKLQDTLESLRKAVGVTIQVMVSAVETRDPYTAGHQIRSAALARTVATEMGLPQDKIDAIRMAGSIHDIGKLSIPAEILSKPTKLSEIEFSLIKEHARQGFEILKGVESSWPLADIVYQHHERMDGSGYPRHLQGDDIIMEARILAVADVVEAMASHRPYRPGLGIDIALNEIEKNSGIFYDNTVADSCLRLFREKGFKLEVASF